MDPNNLSSARSGMYVNPTCTLGVNFTEKAGNCLWENIKVHLSRKLVVLCAWTYTWGLVSYRGSVCVCCGILELFIPQGDWGVWVSDRMCESRVEQWTHCLVCGSGGADWSGVFNYYKIHHLRHWIFPKLDLWRRWPEGSRVTFWATFGNIEPISWLSFKALSSISCLIILFLQKIDFFSVLIPSTRVNIIHSTYFTKFGDRWDWG